MSKLNKIFVFAENEDSLAELVCGAQSLGSAVSVIVAGNESLTVSALAYGVGKVYFTGAYSESKGFADYIPSLINLIKSESPELTLLDTSKNGRLLAGQLAAALKTCVLTDVSEVSADGGVKSVRMVYGGAAFRTEKSINKTTLVCVGAGVFEKAVKVGAKCTVENITFTTPSYGIKFVKKMPKTEHTVNLGAAKRVVAVGRGFEAQEELKLAYDFAAAVGAEVGCTRPIAEGEGWMAKALYIGVSGLMLKPDVYFGFGISGQVQHMVGINQARVVIAVNKDKNAPIFQQADYGIVGDVKTVLPLLKAKFGNK